MARIPAIGPGSARRKQASDVDLNHPWVAVLPSRPKQPSNETTALPAAATVSLDNLEESLMLYAEFNSPALDLLQSYIDSLVELSRMDDARLGLHFFQEWRANAILAHAPEQPQWAAALQEEEEDEAAAAADKAHVIQQQQQQQQQQENENEGSPDSSPIPPVKKRRKSNTPNSHNNNNNNNKSKNKRRIWTDPSNPPPLGSLSLHNTILHNETIQAMVESKMTYHLAVLDLTGIQSLKDEFLIDIVTRAPHLQRLSVKNCRRLTHASLDCLGEYATQLTALDLGGAYNLDPARVIETVAALSKLEELHASGLLWNDALLADVCSVRSWKALSLGFLIPGHVSPNGLKQALMSQGASLQSLAIPFCEHIVDAPLLGVLGRHLPNLVCLDVRGNGALNSLTGWYDGRATIQQPPMVDPQPLLVLARYTGVSKASIEDTKRIHPLQAVELICCLGSDGVGMGIRRYPITTTS